MTQITLHTPFPQDVSPEELDSLAESIRRALPESDVRITVGDQRGAAVPFWEIIYVHIPWDFVGNVSALIIADLVKSWLDDRHRKDETRDKSATILGPDGREIEKMELQSQKKRRK